MGIKKLMGHLKVTPEQMAAATLVCVMSCTCIFAIDLRRMYRCSLTCGDNLNDDFRFLLVGECEGTN